MVLPHTAIVILGLICQTWAHTNGTFAYQNNGTVRLRSDGVSPAHFIIDHGHELNGYTTFKVVNASGDTSNFTVALSEAQSSLSKSTSDGPIAMSAAQDTYRVHSYNISTGNTTHRGRLLQGGVRWQKLSLFSAGDLLLSDVGMSLSHSTVALETSFECSNENWTRIWDTGARTLALSMIEARSIPEFWQISPEGAFIESSAPQPYSGLQAQMLTSYDMDFAARPIQGGFSFKVLSDTLGEGIYVWVDFAGSTISAFNGATEAATLISSAALNLSSMDDRQEWHQVHTSVDPSEIIVYIDDSLALRFSQTSKFYGSFGVGTANGQSAYFTNLTVASDGAKVYSSELKDESALEDFLTGTNPLNVVVDGARRDRIAYAGDIDVAGRSIAASNFELRYINDTLRLLSSQQMRPGFFTPTVKIQQLPRESLIDVNITGLIGYSFNLLSAMGQYYLVSGDMDGAKALAPAAVRMLEWASSQTLENGLFNISNPSLGGDWNYYDPTQSGVVTKFNAVYALALQEVIPMLEDSGVNVTSYRTSLSTLRTAINKHLYSNVLKAYVVSQNIVKDIAQDANAMAILANIPKGNITKQDISRSMADSLFVSHGALPFSNGTTGFSQLISPYASSYHLRAAFEAEDVHAATHLLDHLWAPMTSPSNANYSGCFWETLNLDGGPGLGLGTSLCHAWSSGPTSELTRYVLGIQPLAPGFSQWNVVPQSLGLRWARGSQKTPYGMIRVEWRFDDDDLVSMTVYSPAGTKGKVKLPSSAQVQGDDAQVVTLVNGCVVGNTVFEVVGGETFELTQYRAGLAQRVLEQA